MRQWLTDHGLSLSFASLFFASLAGQSITGHISYNSQLLMHGFPALGYGSYLGTGNFLDGVFTNWQAAVLQLGCLIVFSAKLRERGAAHSLAPVIHAHKLRKLSDKRYPWIYRNSLSLGFATLFVLFFVAHLFFGAMSYNSTLQMAHRPPVSLVHYGVSSTFWFANTQTWEAEFATIAIYVVFSIFLRQQGSPESKPLGSSNRVTGKTNR